MTKQTEIHQDEKVALYEVGYLIIPTVASEQLPGVVEGFHKAITKAEGTILTEGLPMMRDLAYEIAKASVGKKHKFDRAYFGHIVFNAAADKVTLVKKAFDEDAQILRFILVKTDEETVEALKMPLIGAQSDAEEVVEEDAIVKEDDTISEEEIDKKIDTLTS